MRTSPQRLPAVPDLLSLRPVGPALWEPPHKGYRLYPIFYLWGQWGSMRTSPQRLPAVLFYLWGQWGRLYENLPTKVTGCTRSSISEASGAGSMRTSPQRLPAVPDLLSLRPVGPALWEPPHKGYRLYPIFYLWGQWGRLYENLPRKEHQYWLLTPWLTQWWMRLPIQKSQSEFTKWMTFAVPIGSLLSGGAEITGAQRKRV